MNKNNTCIKDIKRQMFSSVKTIIYPTFKSPKIILTRSACLGQSLLAKRFEFTNIANDNRASSYLTINQQKVRVDMFLEWLAGSQRPVIEKVKQHLSPERPYVLEMLEQQENLPWLTIKDDFEYLLMDSFSELTDNKFTNKKEGWSFCCHRSDMVHNSTEFQDLFISEGLLALSSLYDKYLAFFDWFAQKYPDKDIVFFHFPTCLDGREIYNRRSQEIYRIISDLSQTRKYLYSISISNKFVFHAPNDNFPYHFSCKTYINFVNRWLKNELLQRKKWNKNLFLTYLLINLFSNRRN